MNSHCHKKGAALVMMLASLVILTILMGLSIQVTGKSLQKRAKSRKKLQARFAAESGIAYAQSYLHRAKQMGDLAALNGHSKTLTAHTSFKIEAFLDRGFFHVISKGQHLDVAYEVEALLGDKPFDLAKNAFILEESSHELYASGQTHIDGDAVLPQAQVVPRTLHGEPASKLPIVSGKVTRFQSSHSPKINLFYEHEIHKKLVSASKIQFGKNSLSNGRSLNDDPQYRVLELKGRVMKVKTPLSIPNEIVEIRGPGSILCKGNLRLNRNLKLTENLWLVVDGDLEIDGSLDIQANIIVRGNLVSKAELKGSGCLFALNTIEISGRTKLSMPMSMGLLYYPDLSAKTPKKIILKNTSFQGCLFAWQKSGESWQPSILVGPSCQVSGYLVTNGQTQVLSPLEGMVYTRELVSMAGAQRFLNWMKSLQINRKEEIVGWAMPPGFGQEVEVLTWVKR